MKLHTVTGTVGLRHVRRELPTSYASNHRPTPFRRAKPSDPHPGCSVSGSGRVRGGAG